MSTYSYKGKNSIQGFSVSASCMLRCSLSTASGVGLCNAKIRKLRIHKLQVNHSKFCMIWVKEWLPYWQLGSSGLSLNVCIRRYLVLTAICKLKNWSSRDESGVLCIIQWLPSMPANLETQSKSQTVLVSRTITAFRMTTIGAIDSSYLFIKGTHIDLFKSSYLIDLISVVMASYRAGDSYVSHKKPCATIYLATILSCLIVRISGLEKIPDQWS